MRRRIRASRRRARSFSRAGASGQCATAYKIFIIDEVHQLSGHSFNALLKSIEEPPPHVVFMMGDDGAGQDSLKRCCRASQVYEFEPSARRPSRTSLRRIVDAEGLPRATHALRLIARDAEGSMRDAQSKLDQVLAFTGKTDQHRGRARRCSGLVGRDLPLDAVEAVADENAAARRSSSRRAVEMGYDLRSVCRELSRVTRDLLVLLGGSVAYQRCRNFRRVRNGSASRRAGRRDSHARICCGRSIC